ncbi:MAG: aldose epimerase family protein [Rikenellaceae bacterium]
MKNVEIYSLFACGIEMEVTNFGARVMNLYVEDRDGKMEDVVLGYSTTEEYLDNKGERFLGAVCGRFANRIAKGRFVIDGREYKLPINNGENSLHGGIKGLDSVVWDVVKATDQRIDFRYVSPDGEEGYPGDLTIDMCYEVTDDREFIIEYVATTNRPTHVNLTHHSFFNLAGEGNGTIDGHLLQINGDRFIPIDAESLPTGEVRNVEGTPFDFRTEKPIGLEIDADDEQIRNGAGYDHSWVLNGREGAMRLAATLTEPVSGRVMEVYTDQWGMQFYSGNFLDGKTKAKTNDGMYVRRGALALETQLFPDTPNQPEFPSTLLEPGDEYTHRCIYKFDTM